MSYKVDFTDKALEGIEKHKKSGNTSLLLKINRLLDELTEHPYSGTGQPEILKYRYSGQWSRRINREHRMVYSVPG